MRHENWQEGRHDCIELHCCRLLLLTVGQWTHAASKVCRKIRARIIEARISTDALNALCRGRCSKRGTQRTSDCSIRQHHTPSLSQDILGLLDSKHERAPRPSRISVHGSMKAEQRR